MNGVLDWDLTIIAGLMSAFIEYLKIEKGPSIEAYGSPNKNYNLKTLKSE